MTVLHTPTHKKTQKRLPFKSLEQTQKGKARARRCLRFSLIAHLVAGVVVWFIPLHQERTEPTPMVVEFVEVSPIRPPPPRQPIAPKPPEKSEPRAAEPPRAEKKVEPPPAPSPPENAPKPKATPLPYHPLQADAPKEQNQAGRTSGVIDFRHLTPEQASGEQNLLKTGAEVMSYNPLSTRQGSTASGVAETKKGADPMSVRHLHAGEGSTESVHRGKPSVTIEAPQLQDSDVRITPRTSPRLIHRVLPEYPHIPGITRAIVTLQLVVELNGEPREIRVVSTQTEPRQDEAAVPRFESAAIAAAQQCRFQPAFEGDDPVRVTVSIRMTFNLEQQPAPF